MTTPQESKPSKTKKSIQEPKEQTSEPLALHGVIYTDGGYRDGYGGYGIHGYVHDGQVSTKGTGNPKVATTTQGYNSKARIVDATRVSPLNYLDGLWPFKAAGSNNEGEIMAVIKALDYAISKNLKSLTIFSDSEYVVKTINSWLERYEKNGFKLSTGKPAANVQLWLQLLEKKKQYEALGNTLIVQWVKGHNQEPGNERADSLSSMGVSLDMRYPIPEYQEIVERPATGYWKPCAERHPFLDANYLYFTTSDEISQAMLHPEYKGKRCYKLGDNRLEDFQEGKRSSDVSLSYVMLADGDSLLDNLMRRQDELANGLQSYIRFDLSKAYKPLVDYDILNNPELALYRKGMHRLDMVYALDEPLSIEFRPLGIAARTFELTDTYAGILSATLTAIEGKSKLVCVRDVTSCFYIRETKPKKSKDGHDETETIWTLHPYLSTGVPSITVPIEFRQDPSNADSLIQEYNISLLFGYDVLSRNSLKRLEAFKPKVYSVTWPTSETSISYATVIITESGDAGIWAAPFSNSRLILAAKAMAR